jgi:hypothetical protein
MGRRGRQLAISNEQLAMEDFRRKSVDESRKPLVGERRIGESRWQKALAAGG